PRRSRRIDSTTHATPPGGPGTRPVTCWIDLNPLAPAPSFGPLVIAAVLAAALLHAAWNSIAHGIGDRLVGFGMIGVADVVGGGALVAVAGWPAPGAWPYIVGSAVAHIGYNLLLLASYQLGEFSQA